MTAATNPAARQQAIIAATILLFVSGPLLTNGASAESTEMRVMSFNIRYSLQRPHEADSHNDWHDPQHPRRERAIRVIREHGPDILGVQEARERQLVDLRQALPELDFYGVGRDDGLAGGEFCGIFYCQHRFERTAAGTFWLSRSPDQPGTTFAAEPRAVPRLASWVRLRDSLSGTEVLVVNTHWDHRSVPARRSSAALMRQRLAEIGSGIPAIVMGDLNAPEDSPEVITLIGKDDPQGPRLVDSYRAVHPTRSPEEATFNHWRGTTAGSRIDFILHTSEFTATEAQIVRTSYDGRWPSDHYPVTATLAIEPQE